MISCLPRVHVIFSLSPVERVSSDESSLLQLVMPGESAAVLVSPTVPSWQFGDFLNQIFDIWIRRDVERVIVQMFEVALAAWMGQPRFCVFIRQRAATLLPQVEWRSLQLRPLCLSRA